MKIGENIKRIMELQNMSQKELAEKSGLTEASISKYINDERTPRIDAIVSISHALGVDVKTLIDDSEDNNIKATFESMKLAIARGLDDLSLEERAELASYILKNK